MNNKNILPCVYDTRKSFYGKAKYTREELNNSFQNYTIYTLYSYNTKVLILYINNNDISKSFYVCNEYTAYSATTLRHVKEFLHQFSTMAMNYYSILEYKGMTKNNIIKYTRTTKPLQQLLQEEQEEKKNKRSQRGNK